jgi:succinate-acetate transporter protein
MADLRENDKTKKSRVMDSLKFGLTVFPDYGEFWLAILDKLIDHESYV